MKLSIIIPVYNVDKYISRCLDSILDQNLKISDYEVIIVNDGSPDNSLIICEEYSQKHENFHVFNQKNKGVGSARNKGIELAHGNYIYFLDPDDYIAKGTLPILLEYMREYNPEILTFESTKTYSSNLIDSKTRDAVTQILPSIETGIEYIGRKKYRNEIWWYLINKDFLDNTKIKFIEGRWMEDAIFTATLFTRTKRLVATSLDVHRHAVVPNSAMTSRKPGQYLRVIRDNAHAAVVFEPLIGSITNQRAKNEECIKRLKSRQQSYVFFMMVRMLKSTMRLSEIKDLMAKVSRVGAYPLNSFLGEDYNGLSYRCLVALFNKKQLFFIIFILFNPLFRIRNYILK